jgi:hypothetical protein
MRTFISALLIAVLPGSALALQSSANRTDGGVTLRANVSEGVVVDPGDPVSFQYQSVRDATVLVFDIDTQGNVSLLTDEPVSVRAHDTRPLPDDNSELFAEGQPGIEFVFAVAVADPNAFDSQAIAAIRDDNRRITGDPFVAANMLAAEVVRNIAQQTAFMGYTYFYVSQRVDYPAYLCGNGDDKNPCSGYHVAQNFDRGVSLVYPLARGYDMTDLAANSTQDSTDDSVAMPSQQDELNFYPYGAEVHYADPVAMNAWYNWGWYYPYYGYYPYCGYPYGYGYPYGFTIGIGWGWGWGWGYGGYYCGGYYNPYYGCGGYYNDGGYYSGNVVKYKSQYKANYQTANTLAGNRVYAMKRDSNLQVASKGTRTTSTPVAYRTKMKSSNSAMLSSRHVKTTMTGTRGVVGSTWADGRTRSHGGSYASRNGVLYKGGSGRSAMQRGYSRSGTMPYGSSSTRMKSGYSGSNGAHGVWRPSYNGGRSSSSSPARGYNGYSGSRMGGSYKGWSGGSWGGGHGGGFSGGGAFKGGGGGGGAHGGGGGGRGK